MRITEGTYLAHYGILRRSGRYPWGSGNNQSTRNRGYLDYLDKMKAEGLSEAQIAQGLGISTTQMRAAKSIASNQQRQERIAMAERLRAKGMSVNAVGQRMGLNESTVRGLLEPGAKERSDALMSTADILRKNVEEKEFLDVGLGVENSIGVSNTRLATAVAVLQEEGYTLHRVKVPQAGTDKETEYKVLAKPGVTQKEVWQNRDKIRQVAERSDDGGRTFFGLHEPIAVDPSRVAINYAEDGGAQADGVVYVRPGVDDLSLGGSQYAQVRIAVGKEHFIKGMAVYKDDLPDGVDLLFNTNKTRDEAPTTLDALKKQKDDPDNPFGALVRQIVADEGTPNERVVSAMNLVREEGRWSQWSSSIAPQVLSKQPTSLVRDQLNRTHDRRKQELDEILALTNPVVRRKLLMNFAEQADTAAVDLKTMGLPRQSWNVIMPVNSLGDTEIYAPQFRDGERVALIRYPHGGTFEIPNLVVRNGNRDAQKLLGKNPIDAVGINSRVAELLSGADFDGDTVLVIPNNDDKITHTKPIKALLEFDPRTEYRGYPGMKRMTNTQTEMGIISNLITDMTIHGAPQSELARAVKHSMVVIDAEKHGLDYTRSARDNGIAQLKEKYQLQPDGTSGAATLISRAKSKTYVPERVPRPFSEGGPIDPDTGRLVFVETGAVRKDTGAPKLTKSTKLAEATDAHELSSGTTVERYYADYSNKTKAMANQARKAALETPALKREPTASRVYAEEVASLDAKLALTRENKPRERQAQVIANTIISAKREANPGMDREMLNKVKSQALTEARRRVGAERVEVVFTPREWEAIQAGAISQSKLSALLDRADLEQVKRLSTPKDTKSLTGSQENRARSLLALGRTSAEVAEILGVSVNLVNGMEDQ